jgi:DNA-binding response OmpR family regulator
VSTVDAASNIANNIANNIAATHITRHGIALLAWPTEEPTRRVLAASRVPRVLLIAADCAPPEITDSLEDWMRDPIDAVDLEARVRALAHRAASAASPVQTSKADGVVASAPDRTSWVVDDRDIERLMQSDDSIEPDRGSPCIDAESGVLRVGSRWIVISARQLPVAALLIDRFGSVVGRSEVAAAYADVDGSTDPAAFKSMILRLGNRLAQVGLALRVLRGRGYVLEHASEPFGSAMPR